MTHWGRPPKIILSILLTFKNNSIFVSKNKTCGKGLGMRRG